MRDFQDSDEWRAAGTSMARFGTTEANRGKLGALWVSAALYLLVKAGFPTLPLVSGSVGVLTYDSAVLVFSAPCKRGWWAIKDLNLGPLPCEGSALTN